VVEQAAIGVGRAQGNEVEIDDHSVSRRHARLTFEAGRMLVEDLGSANGSYIGSQRVAPNTPTLVPENQVLRLGDVEFRYTPPEPPPPPPGRRGGGENATMIMPGPGASASGAATATKFGALRIRMPDGEVRDFALDQPVITVGRA